MEEALIDEVRLKVTIVHRRDRPRSKIMPTRRRKRKRRDYNRRREVMARPIPREHGEGERRCGYRHGEVRPSRRRGSSLQSDIAPTPNLRNQLETG